MKYLTALAVVMFIVAVDPSTAAGLFVVMGIACAILCGVLTWRIVAENSGEK